MSKPSKAQLNTAQRIYDRLGRGSVADIDAIAQALAEAERLGRDDTDSANLLSIIADIREKSGLGAKPMLGDLAGAIAERIASAEREGKRQAAEIVLAYPPNGFFERLSEATKENSDYETMTFDGDEGNWAYLMSVLLQPYAATITDEAE